MKTTLIYGLLLVFGITNVSAMDYDVVSDEVWVYPTLSGKTELMEERGGTNHFLTVHLEIDQEQTKRDVAEVKEIHPTKKVKAYRMDFVSAAMTLPNIVNQPLNYSEGMGGWWAKAEYVRIPHSKLADAKALLANGQGWKVMTSLWKRSMVETEVMNERCEGQVSEREGIIWFFERLKKFEASFLKLPARADREKNAVIEAFVNRCVNFNMDGVKSFGEMVDVQESQPRITPKLKSFVLKEENLESHYNELAPKVEFQHKSTQY